MGKVLNPELEKLLEESIQRNIEKALEKTMKQVQNSKNKDDYASKTEIILNNFNILKLQTKDVILDVDTIEEIKNKKINELMKDIFVTDDESSIEEVILKSKKRTKVFVNYVEELLNNYIQDRKNLKDDNTRKIKREKRKVLILDNYYINKKFDREEFLERYKITIPTFYKDNEELIEEIKVLIFGIDGLNVL